MENVITVEQQTIPGQDSDLQSLIGNRIDALKALTTLLLREVESLQKMPQIDSNKNGFEKINLMNQVQQYEEDLIRRALIKTGGRQRAAANLLGMKATTLNAKIKRMQIDTYDFVPSR